MRKRPESLDVSASYQIGSQGHVESSSSTSAGGEVWVRQQLSLRSPVDTDLKVITDAVHERLFPGLPRGAAERDAASGLNAQISSLAGELLLWREVCGDLVAADDEARRTWLAGQVRLAEVYRHNLEVIASMLAEGRAYGGGTDDAVGYLAEVLRDGSVRKPWHNTPTCPRCAGPLVAYDHDDESPTSAGLLRCTACGRYAEATAEQRAQAEAADAAWRKHQGGGSDAG